VAPRVCFARGVVFFDTFIASQDGKYTYWYTRSSQLDTNIVPLFPVPNTRATRQTMLPSPVRALRSAHTLSRSARTSFGQRKEAGDSRIWAGIHYPIDVAAGNQLGTSVAQKFIACASTDGSQ
jgi:hypothetical protein